MSTKIIFHEGLNGSGVVVSITYNNSRVIFDFGAPFTPMTQPYDGHVERRKKAWVNDALRLGQIPPIDGVFAAMDLGPKSPILPFEKSRLTTGVIISHLHLDHMSGIGMVHPEIPVYLHRDAYELQKALDDIGESVGERDYSPIEFHQPFMIGEIQVTAYFSDHPCAGAVGYLVATPDGKVYYTGDIRMHGNRVARVVEEMAMVAAEQVDLLIMDTTTLSPSIYSSKVEEIEPSLAIPEGMPTEQQVLDRVLADLLQARGLGIFNIYHRDIEFIKGLFDIAQRSNREIVFEPKTAYIVNRILGLYPAVYVPDNDDYGDKAPAYYSKVIAEAPRIVSVQDINDSPNAWFLQNSYENILELFDLPAEGARYYHLNGVPLVEGARDYANMLRVLRLTHIDYAAFANLYCYNHAFPNNLLYMAERIHAKYLVGVHSSHPERLTSRVSSQQVVPKKGEPVYLVEGRIVGAW